MGLVLAKAVMNEPESVNDNADLGKTSSVVEHFFFTDLLPTTPKSHFSTSHEMIGTDGSQTTASTRDSPDYGGFSRCNSQQESIKSSRIGSIASSLSRVARFRRTSSHNPSRMDAVLPPSVLVIKQTSPEKGSVTRPIKIKRRGQARSYPYPLTASQIADEEDAVDEHLRKLYDMRSWDMYVRITEARKNQQHHIQQATGATAYANNGHGQFLSFPPDHSAATIPLDSSHHHHEASLDHEMIFGDME
jgi:hypothetical protein